MNAKKVVLNLVEEEVKTVENIRFHIQRKVENGYILKDIRFTTGELLKEKVQALGWRF